MKNCKYCSNIESGSIIFVYESKTGTKCRECGRLMYSAKDYSFYTKLKMRLFNPE